MGAAAIGGAVVGGLGLVGSAVSSSNQAGAAKTAANDQEAAALAGQQTELQMFDQTQANLSPWMRSGAGALSQLDSLYGITPPAAAGASGGSALNYSGPGASALTAGGYGTGKNGGYEPGAPRGSTVSQLGTSPSAPASAPASSTASGVPNTASMLTALENTPGYQFQLQQGEQALDRTAASRGLSLSGAQLKDAQTFGQGVAQSSAWQPYVSMLTGLSGSGQNAAAGLGGFAAGYANSSSQLGLAGGQAAAAGAVGSANAWSSGLQSALGNSMLGYQMGSQGSAIGGGFSNFMNGGFTPAGSVGVSSPALTMDNPNLSGLSTDTGWTDI